MFDSITENGSWNSRSEESLDSREDDNTSIPLKTTILHGNNTKENPCNKEIINNDNSINNINNKSDLIKISSPLKHINDINKSDGGKIEVNNSNKDSTKDGAAKSNMRQSKYINNNLASLTLGKQKEPETTITSSNNDNDNNNNDENKKSDKRSTTIESTKKLKFITRFALMPILSSNRKISDENAEFNVNFIIISNLLLI